MNRLKLWAGFFAKARYPQDVNLICQAFAYRRNFPVPAATWAALQNIGGFMSAKEAGILDWAARACPVTGPVIELGSYEDRSTIVWALAGRVVHAIDAWSLDVADRSAYAEGGIPANAVFQRFQANLTRAGVAAQVTTHRGYTHTLGREWAIPGAILFIDAGHTYADVRGDLDLYTPRLLPGGLLLMHDVLGDTYLDVTRAASELLQAGWRVVASAGSIVAFARR
jgi:hypothetical protein